MTKAIAVTTPQGYAASIHPWLNKVEEQYTSALEALRGRELSPLEARLLKGKTSGDIDFAARRLRESLTALITDQVDKVNGQEVLEDVMLLTTNINAVRYALSSRLDIPNDTFPALYGIPSMLVDVPKKLLEMNALNVGVPTGPGTPLIPQASGFAVDTVRSLDRKFTIDGQMHVHATTQTADTLITATPAYLLLRQMLVDLSQQKLARLDCKLVNSAVSMIAQDPNSDKFLQSTMDAITQLPNQLADLGVFSTRTQGQLGHSAGGGS